MEAQSTTYKSPTRHRKVWWTEELRQTDGPHSQGAEDRVRTNNPNTGSRLSGSRPIKTYLQVYRFPCSYIYIYTYTHIYIYIYGGICLHGDSQYIHLDRVHADRVQTEKLQTDTLRRQRPKTDKLQTVSPIASKEHTQPARTKLIV